MSGQVHLAKPNTNNSSLPCLTALRYRLCEVEVIWLLARYDADTAELVVACMVKKVSREISYHDGTALSKSHVARSIRTRFLSSDYPVSFYTVPT
jgi:hypothetical protein